MKLTRKKFIAAAGAGLVCSAFAGGGKEEKMDGIIQKKLPFAENALEPVISAKTLSFHYGKHHSGYVAALNKLIAGTEYAALDLREIVSRAWAKQDGAVFNNAAQAWNHEFFWQCLGPADCGGEPQGAFAAAVARDFGSFAELKRVFAEAAVKRFGSGWAWLVVQDGKLSIESTANAETPLVRPGARPLAVVDVWEHAYYLDWQNRRADYVKQTLDRLICWKAIEI